LHLNRSKLTSFIDASEKDVDPVTGSIRHQKHRSTHTDNTVEIDFLSTVAITKIAEDRSTCKLYNNVN
jgi:hypothetical protein